MKETQTTIEKLKEMREEMVLKAISLKQIISQLEIANEMAESLEKCRAQFAFYTANHLSAGKADREKTNSEFAELCLSVLIKWEKIND